MPHIIGGVCEIYFVPTPKHQRGMKRSLSFTDLKDLTPGEETNSTRNVRKIQSCAGRFQETESPDFLDEFLEEYENEEHLQCQSPEKEGRLNLHLPTDASADPLRPLFTTHDLTSLLSFLQSNPPIAPSSNTTPPPS